MPSRSLVCLWHASLSAHLPKPHAQEASRVLAQDDRFNGFAVPWPAFCALRAAGIKDALAGLAVLCQWLDKTMRRQVSTWCLWPCVFSPRHFRLLPHSLSRASEVVIARDVSRVFASHQRIHHVRLEIAEVLRAYAREEHSTWPGVG